MGSKMNKIKGKIMPLINPNFQIKETYSELLEIVKTSELIPVINQAYIKKNIVQNYADLVIGFIGADDLYINDGFICGDIIFRGDKEYEWVNTEIQVGDDMNIVNLSAVIYKERIKV